MTEQSLCFPFVIIVRHYYSNISFQPIPLEETACNIPKVCKLNSRELRKQRYLYTCKECPDTYPWIKNEFGMDFK